jgi:inner membrane protein
MLLKTHYVIIACAIILFLPQVNNPFSFILMALIATILPDFDTRFSKHGKNPIARVMQVFTKHRGMIHSLTICFISTVLISLFFPKLAFGFFLGYSMHLLTNSFTKNGITVFWPLKAKAEGVITTGSKIETGIFFTFLVLDVLLGVLHVIRLFWN